MNGGGGPKGVSEKQQLEEEETRRLPVGRITCPVRRHEAGAQHVPGGERQEDLQERGVPVPRERLGKVMSIS